jgi:hypothetical protein
MEYLVCFFFRRKDTWHETKTVAGGFVDDLLVCPEFPKTTRLELEYLGSIAIATLFYYYLRSSNHIVLMTQDGYRFCFSICKPAI